MSESEINQDIYIAIKDLVTVVDENLPLNNGTTSLYWNILSVIISHAGDNRS